MSARRKKMVNDFSEPVEKIVNNYLARLKDSLKGFPENDKEELVKEIHSHIYESFISDPTEDNVDRIFNVLNKLGEPSDVVATRMSESMVDMGKKKKLPMYILAGVLIGLFGIPLGLGGVAVLIGILITVGTLIFSYYVIAISLIISGWIGLIASIIQIINPAILPEYIHIYNDIIIDPVLGGIAGVVSSVLVALLGLGMLWLGKYMMRGIRFVFSATIERIRGRGQRRR
jgi:uncharacterized membrane protein